MKATGLGDTIEKITTITGVKKAVDTVSKILKKPCGIAVSHPSSWSILVDPYLIRDGWLKIISKIKEYEWIPLELRINVEQMSMENIKRLLFWNGLGYISRSDFENAYKISNNFHSGIVNPLH